MVIDSESRGGNSRANISENIFAVSQNHTFKRVFAKWVTYVTRFGKTRLNAATIILRFGVPGQNAFP